MWHHVAATPVHRFNERAILLVFRHRQGAMAGTLVLQTARSLDRGAICMTARLSLHLHAEECFAQIGTGSS